MSKFNTGGALSGAATGAKLGSFGGPIGMAVGGVLGAAGGGFLGGDDENPAANYDPLYAQKMALANNAVAKSNIGIAGLKNIAPYQKEIDTRYYDSPIWGQKMDQAEALNPQIQYEEIGIKNQNVQDIASLLDQGSTSWAKDLMGQRDDAMASKKGFGSSFNTATNAELEQNLADRHIQNQLKGLDAYKSIYASNLANQQSLMNYYTNQPTMNYSGMVSSSTPSITMPPVQEQSSSSDISSMAGSLGSLSSLFGSGGDGGLDILSGGGGTDLSSFADILV